MKCSCPEGYPQIRKAGQWWRLASQGISNRYNIQPEFRIHAGDCSLTDELLGVEYE